MTDCTAYNEDFCGSCSEMGGAEAVGCYKPVKTKTDPVAKLHCSDGLESLVVEMNRKEDYFKEKWEKEPAGYEKTFAEGRRHGYNDAACMLKEFIKKAF